MIPIRNRVILRPVIQLVILTKWTDTPNTYVHKRLIIVRTHIHMKHASAGNENKTTILETHIHA